MKTHWQQDMVRSSSLLALQPRAATGGEANSPQKSGKGAENVLLCIAKVHGPHYMGFRESPLSHVVPDLVWQTQRDTGLRKSHPEIPSPTTGQLNPAKAYHPPGVCTSPAAKSPRTRSKRVQGNQSLWQRQMPRYYFRKILHFWKKKLTYNSNNAKCGTRTG